MRKETAVASLGQSPLLVPAWVKAALAAMHAASPRAAVEDWVSDLARSSPRERFSSGERRR